MAGGLAGGPVGGAPTPPRPELVAFTGAGRRLGGGAAAPPAQRARTAAADAALARAEAAARRPDAGAPHSPAKLEVVDLTADE
jgi:hypothetical protein